MSVTNPEATFVRITDETTRAELLVTLRILLDEAKAISRRGIAFARTDDGYELLHARISAVAAELEARA